MAYSYYDLVIGVWDAPLGTMVILSAGLITAVGVLLLRLDSVNREILECYRKREEMSLSEDKRNNSPLNVQ